MPNSNSTSKSPQPITFSAAPTQNQPRNAHAANSATFPSSNKPPATNAPSPPFSTTSHKISATPSAPSAKIPPSLSSPSSLSLSASAPTPPSSVSSTPSSCARSRSKTPTVSSGSMENSR